MGGVYFFTCSSIAAVLKKDVKAVPGVVDGVVVVLVVDTVVVATVVFLVTSLKLKKLKSLLGLGGSYSALGTLT